MDYTRRFLINFVQEIQRCCIDTLNVDEIDLLTKFEFIEPELLDTYYIDINTPDNP